MSLLTKLLTWLGVHDGPDPVWKPTGFKYTATGHDERTAALAATRTAHLAEARRKLAALRSEPPAKDGR